MTLSVYCLCTNRIDSIRYDLIDESEQRKPSSPRPQPHVSVLSVLSDRARLGKAAVRSEAEYASRNTGTSGVTIGPRTSTHMDSQPNDHTPHRGGKKSTEKWHRRTAPAIE